MIGRRKLVGGGVLAGMAAAVSTGDAQQQTDRGDVATAAAIDKLREVFERRQDSCEIGPCGAIAQIRVQQRVFLKANQKFPDFIDVGIDVWEDVYDWHIRNHQPINTTRLPDGRYGLAFMFTTLVMRPDNTANFISFGYDGR
jgi:hypothetical protein